MTNRKSQPKQTRHLVLDSRIIHETVAAKLTLGEITKHPRNSLRRAVNG